jgi:hypothetical protein
MDATDEKDAHCTTLALLQQAWPIAALASAVLVNVLWIGVLGYALISLL